MARFFLCDALPSPRRAPQDVGHLPVLMRLTNPGGAVDSIILLVGRSPLPLAGAHGLGAFSRIDEAHKCGALDSMILLVGRSPLPPTGAPRLRALATLIRLTNMGPWMALLVGRSPAHHPPPPCWYVSPCLLNYIKRKRRRAIKY